ncbi:MAG: hypothetical protein J6Z49_01000, partial [Kiritimatiellae bacterium]|nr:hypothetical protein [Kiritimatiellia bacterium]
AWSAGGAGGVGVGSAISGETLFYGAGGGGGYIYRTANADDGTVNFTKPGGGGSGIGGDAADVRNGKLATSGVPNTGAGGGGGSSRGKGDGKTVDESDSTYWQGGNGGDGVVLISYEAHGRDPIAEEPRITMSRCEYISSEMIANINYRAYWAGIQAQTNDIYVLYSTVSEEDVAAGNGEMVKVEANTIGIGSTTFTPPAVGYTYWVRLVARKDANSFMYSDEIASFEVPAIELNGTEPKMPVEDDASQDSAEISYNLYDTASDARLYCYWSENRADLEGDVAPTGGTVHFLDLGTGRAGKELKFTIYAEDGLERNKTYYVRLATGNEAGTKYFLSKQIVLLEMIDKPRVIFEAGVWSNHVATVDFHETTATLDPATVELIALYSGIEADISADPVKTDLIHKPGVVVVNLGTCDGYPDDENTTTQFPMWSPCNTNFYVRLALATNGVPVSYSQRYHSLMTITAVSPNTLLVYVNAHAKIGCYGDEPQPLTYTKTYGGLTEGAGWDKWVSSGENLTGAMSCDVTNLSPTGQYAIARGTLALGDGGQTTSVLEPKIDPVTGEVVTDPYTGETVNEPVQYYYELIFTGSRYTVTNAQFAVSIADARTVYTGEDFNVTSLDTTVTGLRNDQPITYMYRVGTNDWASTITTTYSDIWTHIVQFKATAPNHDEVRGTFMITVDPAPLFATISAEDLNYLGVPQIPNITTNVTGHVRPDLNPLTVEFRDESSEWQSEIPSFTKPGQYRLFFRVSAPNHTSFTTNCTFMVEEWDYWVNMDGREGFAVPIHISDPAWLLKTTGEDAAYFADNTDNRRYKILDQVCDNGLKLWQNYMIDRTDLGKKLVAAVRQSGNRVNEDSFVVYFPNVAVLRNTGLNVAFRLDKKLRYDLTKDEFAATDFVKGELSDKYEMNVPLEPGDPTGLYVFNIVLSPTNDVNTGEALYGGGESVLASVATIGVLRVSSAITNTVTVAPWLSMSVDSTNEINIAVADVVNPFCIGGGDAIHAYETSGTFRKWERKDNGDWSAPSTVTTNGVSQSPAEESMFEPGKAFWLVRKSPGSYIYLVGRYTGGDYVAEIEGGTAESPVHSLIANPTFFDIDLNDLVFVDGEGNAATPAADDRIITQNTAGVQTIYYRQNGKWGRNIATKNAKGRVTQQWTEGGSIPAGTGFWYTRTSSETLRINFEAAR